MNLRKTLISFCILNLLTQPLAFADAQKTTNEDFDLSKLALPSEVKNLGKSAGSIFYSPSLKGKILIPVNIWGEVKKSGLHFVPLETNLPQGISFAGGPSSSAKLKSVQVSRFDKNGEIISEEYDMRRGGGKEAALKVLKPGDTVFVEKSTFTEDRAYYTSLIGVVTTILSSILIYRQVKE